MEYQSERLRFREFGQEDFDLFLSIFSNEQIMRYALLDRYDRKEELMPFFREVLENNRAMENRKAYEFAVFRLLDSAFIGFADIEISNRNASGGCGEIGYFLLPPFWGRGYATEMANTLVEICFKHLKLHRVSASCNAKNTQSEQVMKKIGMGKEGLLRKARFKNGSWDDEVRYSILIEEWMHPSGRNSTLS